MKITSAFYVIFLFTILVNIYIVWKTRKPKSVRYLYYNDKKCRIKSRKIKGQILYLPQHRKTFRYRTLGQYWGIEHETLTLGYRICYDHDCRGYKSYQVALSVIKDASDQKMMVKYGDLGSFPVFSNYQKKYE